MNPMSAIAALLSKDDTTVDSLILAVLIAMLTLCGVSTYVALFAPASWSPFDFASAAAVLIGAGAGGKTVRDRFTPTQGTPPAP